MLIMFIIISIVNVERGSSVVEFRTRNRVSPGSNPPLLPFRRLDIFVLSGGRVGREGGEGTWGREGW